MYEDAVVDLETLDTKDSAIIVSIGMVAFNIDQIDNIEELEDEARGLYLFPDMDEQAAGGRSASPSTLQWWIHQAPHAKATFNDQIRRETSDLIGDHIIRFVEAHGIKYLWGYGNMFDNAILRSYFHDFKLRYPIGFRNDLDIRTLERITGVKIKDLGIPRGTLHDAYQDALAEAQAVQYLIQRARTARAGRAG